MKQMMRALYGLVLSLLLALLATPAVALAQGGSSTGVATGSYQFLTTDPLASTPVTGQDTFEFRETCFTESSHIGCTHLSLLSAQTALTSKHLGYLTQMLTDMGFTDIRANASYSTNTTAPDSMGVCVGRRTIVADGVPYTLLAVVPRSAGYVTEWVGNFNVGDASSVHEGFKLARDEVLRFARAYVQSTGITGNVKIWCPGHSRGAAVSSLVAGFLTDCGSEYLGVSITPADVYCFGTGTPNHIAEGADASSTLTVSAARTNAPYDTLDTPGEVWHPSQTGTIEPTSATYNGIHHHLADTDVVTMLPPDSWGLTRYGGRERVDGGVATEADMAAELEQLSPEVYAQYVRAKNSGTLQASSLDLSSLLSSTGASDLLSLVSSLLSTTQLDGSAALSHYSELYVSWARAVNKKAETVHGVTRLGGATRYETMEAVSQAGFASAHDVVLATGESFADALSAAGLAGTCRSPVILTQTGTLTSEARSELLRLGCSAVHLVGGPNAVSDAVASELAGMGISVERVAGADRADTSLSVMRAMGGAPTRVVVASGASFADALSVGAWCYATKTPILLTGSDKLLTQAEIDALRGMPSVTEVVVVGGSGSVGDVESQLAGIAQTTRLSGADRYETSAEIARWASETGLGWSRVTIASGAGFADALAGSALAGSTGATMLLAANGSDVARQALAAHASAISELSVLGGTQTVPESLVSELVRALA